MTQPHQKKPQSVDPRRLKLTNDAGTQGVLLGCRCRQCGVYGFGPAAFCQACTAGDLEPVELSSRGTLYSYTIVRVAPAGWPGQVPYVLGQVELPEGPHILAEVIDCDEAGLQIGVPVELALSPVKAEGAEAVKVVYKFRPQPRRVGAAGARKDNSRASGVPVER
jgi:uncharacterized OB-fold protein